MHSMKVVAKNVDEMYTAARDYAKRLVARRDRAIIIGLTGELGTGKTTFVKGAASYFGLNENVTSPTFVIQKIYPLQQKRFEKMVHVDAHRLAGESELSFLGWDRLVSDPKHVIFVEWPEHLGTLIPKDTEILRFTFVDDHTRTIELPDSIRESSVEPERPGEKDSELTM